MFDYLIARVRDHFGKGLPAERIEDIVTEKGSLYQLYWDGLTKEERDALDIYIHENNPDPNKGRSPHRYFIPF